MRLYVTRKDFSEGVNMNCYRCPVGRSANRAAKRYGYWKASVGVDCIHFEVIEGDDPAVVCKRHFPGKVSKFIRDFDSGRMNAQEFKPFSFEIQDIPDLTAGNPGSAVYGKARMKKKRKYTDKVSPPPWPAIWCPKCSYWYSATSDCGCYK